MDSPRILEVLIRYDVPLVAAARSNTKTYVCLNVEERDDGIDKFLVTSVRPPDIRRFIDEEVDLRFLLRARATKHYFANSSGAVGDALDLERTSDAIDQYLPDPGLFLRDYVGKLRGVDGANAPVTTRKIAIAGNWSLDDFRKLSNVLGDAYTFLLALSPVSGVKTDRVRTLFHKYPWKGGYSAVNFFDQLSLAIPFRYRPAVAEMVKQSPGFIDLTVHKTTASQLVTLVKQIGDRDSNQQLTYTEVRRQLRERHWLGQASADVKLKAADITFLTDQIEVMASVLHLHSRVSFINDLAQNDPLAAVKILLSVYRRVKELSDYLDTGKAQFDDA